ncbi:DUF4129 domain-containing protein [Pyrococcus abyssi]|uniref:Protein-glutamine gamma-glutamyltransferase-like C-terminal domain-containing protein n=1 Tax=Pyrococcus abyssi (strain GE5 / Orsay) TaxID=272844 RepID=G8ZH87_PYRAB|nr:DUF4129 domain-containing protein [Pyrococcus abyssi]CCE70724.1 TPA: hypothetical protein PAB0846 [Pyrococcus abyssi GE5]
MKKSVLGLFIALMILIGTMQSNAVTSWGGVGRTLGVIVLLMFSIYLVVGIFLLILAFMSGRDIGIRAPKGSAFNPLFLLLSMVLAMFYFMFILKIASMRNVKRIALNTTYSPNASFIIPSPETKVHEVVMSKPVLYLPLLLLIIVIVLFGLYTFRDLSRSIERRKTKRELQNFDRKLDEEGIDLFSDPRKAIIELYKKAVLWLEILGIPYKESWTHWEHAGKVTHKRIAYVELVKLFEKAKYAPEKVTRRDALKAYELYMVIRGED